MNIAIIDDHQILLDGLQKVVLKKEGVKIVNTYISSVSFLEYYKSNLTQFDLLMIDVEMPEMNGPELIVQIHKINHSQKILVLSMHKEAALIQNLFSLKIDGYISKNCNSSELHEAISTILNGEKFITEDVAALLTPSSISEEVLTPREIEIIQFLSKGLSSKMIADKLSISDHTVNTHRKNILFKLDLANTAELIKYAVENKLS